MNRVIHIIHRIENANSGSLLTQKDTFLRVRKSLQNQGLFTKALILQAFLVAAFVLPATPMCISFS
jgi:hypothetical protein